MNTILKCENHFFTLLVCLLLVVLASCKKENPQPENVPEAITKTVLVFTPADGGPALTYEANDPDGDGPADLTADAVMLKGNTTYTLTIQLYNGLLQATDEGYVVSDEVRKESDQHQFFFEWNPAALLNGNITYNDKDKNNLPVGLSTTLTTGASGQSGTFRVVLKHQPNIKSATTGINDGETDLDVTFDTSLK